MNKLAIVCTHPIQYYVPVFRLLSKHYELKVFYTWGEKGIEKKYDPGFGKSIEWDVPLLDGYNYELLENIADDPGSHHRRGIINPGLNKCLAAFQPNAILVYGWNYDSHWKAMRYFKGKIPIWFRGDSTRLDEKPGLKSWLKKIYLNWVYTHIDKAFYVGTQNKAYFKKYGLKEHQLIFAPHAIDNERFGEDREQESIALRERLGVAENDTLILFAGKLEPKKNPELLLQAFLQLINEKQANNYHLLFVGNGLLEKSLKQKAVQFIDEMATSLAMTNRIHFMDFQNQTQMPVIYQACDIFCLPSQGPGETWGLAVNEAMAAGKAVVVSDKVGCAVDLVHEVNGTSFQSTSLQELKAALIKITAKDLKTLGLASKKMITNWSFHAQVNSFKNEC